MLLLATDFTGVLTGSLILYGGLSGIGPTLDARTLETLGPERRSRYGEVRAFGSLAFVLSTVAVGFLLDVKGARSLFWVYLPLLIGTVVVTATIPRRGSTHSVNLLRGAGQFLSTSGIALFLTGFTVVWTALASVTAFYSIQVVALGGSPGLVGVAWAFGAVIEVPFTRLGRRRGDRGGDRDPRVVPRLRGRQPRRGCDPRRRAVGTSQHRADRCSGTSRSSSRSRRARLTTSSIRRPPPRRPPGRGR